MGELSYIDTGELRKLFIYLVLQSIFLMRWSAIIIYYKSLYIILREVYKSIT